MAADGMNTLGASVANIYGTESSDVLRGTTGIDYIEGRGGDDLIDGLYGADVLDGGDGNDSFVFSVVMSGTPLAERGRIIGGSGIDTIYLNYVTDYSFEPIANGGGPRQLGLTVGNQSYALNSIERIYLSAANDVVSIPSDAPVLEFHAGDGNDRLIISNGSSVYGEAGDDVVYISGFVESGKTGSVIGGAGTNTLITNGYFTVDLLQGYAGRGNQGVTIGHYIVYEIQNLRATMGDGVVVYYGDDANNAFDVVESTLNDDRSRVYFDGRGGDDRLSGSNGGDTLIGGSGNDTLSGNGGWDLLNGGAGDDVIDGGDGFDVASYSEAFAGVSVSLLLQGKAQNTVGGGTDTLVNIEHLTGSAFADTLAGDAAGNQLIGGGGNDMMAGNAGNDLLEGGEGNDVLYGNTGNDTLYGDNGNDVLFGGQGNDFLRGGTGADYLEGGLGNDSLFGDGESDTAGYINAASGVIVSLVPQGVNGSSSMAQNTIGAGFDSLYDISNLTGSGFADTLTGDANANILTGGSGNDVLNGLFGSDTLFGDDGDDTLYGNQDNDTLNGGFGYDTMYGGQGNDALYGNQNDDTLVGGLGNDQLFGGQGNDSLSGGDGNDILVGGLGINVLNGGAGADIFVMNAQGRDSIADFIQSDGDRIDVRPVGFTSASQLLVTQASDVGHYVVEGDLNGDGVAEFHLDVFGAAVAPNQDAFIFA